MIKENCRCGATFEITSGDKDFQSYRYSEFLRAHEVCRKKKIATDTQQSNLMSLLIEGKYAIEDDDPQRKRLFLEKVDKLIKGKESFDEIYRDTNEL